MQCNVCSSCLGIPIYTSSQVRSITSLCEVLPQKTEVYYCRLCSHLQTKEIENSAHYYDQTYRILLESEEEDQLYAVNNNKNIFRVDHQVATFMRKVSLKYGAHVLDYGCAKAATLRRLCKLRPDIVPCVFDVSTMYLPFWEKFLKPESCATYQIPKEWHGQFDVVMSYFALEHVARPRQFLESIRQLLKPNGTIYGIVPNAYVNIADFVVLDHTNHFSPISLRYSLETSGFTAVDVDTEIHEGALVFSARLSSGEISLFEPEKGHMLEMQVQNLAKYWSSIGQRIRQFEKENEDWESAIYGSGFYGTFVATCLERLERVLAFVDRNPYRWGKELLKKPILAPSALEVKPLNVYVGLNPRNAMHSIKEVKEWQNRAYKYCYL